jgi:hypothetical protein
MFRISLTGNWSVGLGETINRFISRLTKFIGSPLIGRINRELQHISSSYVPFHISMLPLIDRLTLLLLAGEAMEEIRRAAQAAV